VDPYEILRQALIDIAAEGHTEVAKKAAVRHLSEEDRLLIEAVG
jgi:hypothetical protein